MSTTSKSLVGKVIRHCLHGFLVLEELDAGYVGFWASGYSRAEAEELTKAQVGKPVILADSLEEYIATESKKAVDAAGRAKYRNTVCLNASSTLGIVTSYEDATAYGMTFNGTEWRAARPVIQARSVNDYVNKKARERAEKV